MTTTSKAIIANPAIVFYGPHPCDLCGSGPIVRGSVEQGFGDIRLDFPNYPIYPNHKWEEHKCRCLFQIGQDVEWDGEEGLYSGKIADITESSPCTYVLSVGEFSINASCVRALKGRDLAKLAIDESDEGLQEFIRDSAAIKTKVENKWKAWMSDRDDGIVGTGETESAAVKALAEQYRGIQS